MGTDSRVLGGLDLLSAIVATGSFVSAGKRVGLTQSGVSRAVARLEQRVGVRLFDRNARAVVLTDEGRRFHEQVAPLLAALEDAVDGAASAAARVRGRLRINADAFFASHVLAPRLPAFLEAHPELELEVVVSERAGDLVAEGFDVAVRFGTPQGEGLVARRLLQTRIVTCAAPAYLKRHGRPRHPRDLVKGHECILFRDPQSGRPFDWDFHGARKRLVALPVRGRLFVNDGATALAACVAGQGIAQPMELGLRDLLRDGTLVELFPDWQDELFPSTSSTRPVTFHRRGCARFSISWSRRQRRSGRRASPRGGRAARRGRLREGRAGARRRVEAGASGLAGVASRGSTRRSRSRAGCTRS